MRLCRLDLLRYGHLSDMVLDIPASAALCVVHGANEAGKSTALAAIGDALFGFAHRTAYDFLHGGPNLRVGMTLAARDGTSRGSSAARAGAPPCATQRRGRAAGRSAAALPRRRQP